MQSMASAQSGGPAGITEAASHPHQPAGPWGPSGPTRSTRGEAGKARQVGIKEAGSFSLSTDNL